MSRLMLTVVLIGFILITLFMFVIFLSRGVFGGDAGIILKIKGWFCMAGLCGFLLMTVMRFFEPTERIRVDRHGIIFRDWSDDVIRWTDIQRIAVKPVYKRMSVTLLLVDPRKYPAKKFPRNLCPLERGYTGVDITLSHFLLDTSLDELWEAVARGFDEHLQQPSPSSGLPATTRPVPVFGRKNKYWGNGVSLSAARWSTLLIDDTEND